MSKFIRKIIIKYFSNELCYAREHAYRDAKRTAMFSYADAVMDSCKSENTELKQLLNEALSIIKSLSSNPLNGDRAEIKTNNFLNSAKVKKYRSEK